MDQKCHEEQNGESICDNRWVDTFPLPNSRVAVVSQENEIDAQSYSKTRGARWSSGKWLNEDNEKRGMLLIEWNDITGVQHNLSVRHCRNNHFLFAKVLLKFCGAEKTA